jgi:uncharacterized SAM-binding protein YcdF (DUF218 family)
MTSLVAFVFSPSGILVTFLVGAIWTAARPRSRRAHAFLIITAAGYVLCSTYLVAFGAASLLASGYHRFNRGDAPSGRTAIVVLGSGVDPVFGWDEVMYLPSPIAASRALETVRVYNMLNPEWLISSGGNVDPDDAAEPSSTNMRELLVRLGVPPRKILLQSTSRDTHEEAVLIASMVRSLGADALVVVTSAVHMRRSLGAFRAAGLNPVPAIAPDPGFRLRAERFVPGQRGLSLSREVVHEAFGIPYYWVRGWWR